MQKADPSVGGPTRLEIALDYHNVVDAHFLRLAVEEGLTTVHGVSWITTATATNATLGETVAEANYSGAGRLERLVRLEKAVVHLVLFDVALHLRIAAADRDACEAALEQVRSAMPTDPGAEDEVPVRFWWWQPQGADEMGRTMPAPRWEQIRANYSDRTLAGLDDLMSWCSAPAGAGRLMLWHGPPGTGKTTAIRALARAWRSWADFEFITDPEWFLRTPSYLLSTIADRWRPGPGSGSERWRVLVLEDSGEFLAPDAKQLAGQALSRLLNVCDGVLGQATRSLVLVTTNEDLRTLHPALSRPGRCLSENQFHEFNRVEVDRWCASRGIEAVPSTPAALADLFAYIEGRRHKAREPGFGFTAIA